MTIVADTKANTPIPIINQETMAKKIESTIKQINIIATQHAHIVLVHVKEH